MSVTPAISRICRRQLRLRSTDSVTVPTYSQVFVILQIRGFVSDMFRCFRHNLKQTALSFLSLHDRLGCGLNNCFRNQVPKCHQLGQKIQIDCCVLDTGRCYIINSSYYDVLLYYRNSITCIAMFVSILVLLSMAFRGRVWSIILEG